MSNEGTKFKERVFTLVSSIPYGRAMTYGDIAAYAGQPNGARIVGQIAHFGPPGLPWQRVVNRFGGLASGYYGGRSGHKTALELEGVSVDDEYKIINFEEIRWRPEL